MSSDTWPRPPTGLADPKSLFGLEAREAEASFRSKSTFLGTLQGGTEVFTRVDK